MSDIERCEDRLPDPDDFDIEEADHKRRIDAILVDYRKLGIMANGEPENGEQTWYLTEAGVKWGKGELSLDLEELAEDEDISEEDLYTNFQELKTAEKILHEAHTE